MAEANIQNSRPPDSDELRHKLHEVRIVDKKYRNGGRHSKIKMRAEVGNEVRGEEEDKVMRKWFRGLKGVEDKEGAGMFGAAEAAPQV